MRRYVITGHYEKKRSLSMFRRIHVSFILNLHYQRNDTGEIRLFYMTRRMTKERLFYYSLSGAFTRVISLASHIYNILFHYYIILKTKHL